MSSAVPRGTRWFVTGTDTGVGKTWVSCRLLEHWRAEGLSVAGLKAAESGNGTDDALLVAAAGGAQTERCAYRFEASVAPGVAAEEQGEIIDFERIVGQVERLAVDRLIVEGAGGWRVPMGQGRTVADLARRLGLPVVIVARAGLGTINHSVLTIEAIERDGLRLAAVAMSLHPDADRVLAERNRIEIARMTSRPVVLVRDSVAELARSLYGA